MKTTIRIEAILLTLLSLACADLTDPSANPDPTFARGQPGGGATTPSITVTDIGALPGSNYARADGINGAGEAVGMSTVGSEDHAFHWSDGLMVDLRVGRAEDVSAGGRVAGTRDVNTDQQRAVVWEQVGGTWTRTDLPVGVNGTKSSAQGINPRGDLVAGNVSDAPVLWTKSVGGWNLTVLPSNLYKKIAYAKKVNDAGVIIGDANTGAAAYRGVVWTNNGGSMTMLARLPGASCTRCDDAIPAGINGRGDIVGYSHDANGVQRAVVWWRVVGGGWSEPDVIGETQWSSAWAGGINDETNPKVVGSGVTGRLGGTQVGFLWDASTGTTTLLKTKGGTAALAINGLRIVGSGYDYTRAVMWTVN